MARTSETFATTRAGRFSRRSDIAVTAAAVVADHQLLRRTPLGCVNRVCGATSPKGGADLSRDLALHQQAGDQRDRDEILEPTRPSLSRFPPSANTAPALQSQPAFAQDARWGRYWCPSSATLLTARTAASSASPASARRLIAAGLTDSPPGRRTRRATGRRRRFWAAVRILGALESRFVRTSTPFGFLNLSL